MLPEKNNLNQRNKITPLNYDNDLMNKVLKDLEKDFNIPSDNIIPSSITSIKKKTTSNHINTQSIPSKRVSDNDLLTSMTKRLNIIEKQLSDERKKSNQFQSQIKQLLIENQNLKEERELKTEKSDSNCMNCKKLKEYIVSLTNYAEELREFLKENGFILLNQMPTISDIDIDSKDAYMNKIVDKNSNDVSEEDHDDYIKILPKEIDIEVLSTRIEEMNMLLLKDGHTSKFEMDEDKIFKLKRQKELKIFFYNNGIVIEGYKFYEYNSSEANRILHDILDGYTPYKLKNDYPNGVLMSSVNNLHKQYNKENISNTSNGHIKSLDEPFTTKDKISGEEFLKKFPEKVIKNGKIYNIKEDMEQFLVHKRDHEYNIDTSEYYLNCDKENENESRDTISKLKIKLICVDRIITLNVIKNDKLITVFEFIRKILNSSVNKMDIDKYCLYSTFPFKVYLHDDSKTIEENGLHPSYFMIFDLKEKFIEKK